MADIKIIIDTSADMPEEIREKNDIGIIRFLTVFGETSYVSGVDITNDEFYERLTTGGIHPTTAQTPYADMYDYLLEESKKHETVIYFTISSKGSGQNHTAHMIVDEIKEEANPNADIRIVDTMRYSIYIAAAAILASELQKEGKSADEIIDACLKYMEEWEAYLVVDDLQYLQKGGRISATKAIVGSLLDIKPVLTIRDGLIEQADKLRGKKKLVKKLIELVNENPNFDSEKKEFMVIQSDDKLGQEVVESLKEEYGDIKLTLYSEFGPIVGTHTGPGCFAIVFRIK